MRDFSLVARAAYLANKFGAVRDEHVPPGGMAELQLAQIVTETGWTYEYALACSEARIQTLLGVWDGAGKSVE